VLGLVGPGLAACLLVLFARLHGCDPDAAGCGPMPGLLEQTLNIAWSIPMDLRLLGGLTAITALAAPFAAPHRASALTTASIATATAPTAAFVLPHVAVLTTLPTACRLNEGSSAGCTLWGHDMGISFGYAGAAFWLIMLIGPMIVAGVAISCVIATFRPRKPA
jgi:hypothetical protein